MPPLYRLDRRALAFLDMRYAREAASTFNVQLPRLTGFSVQLPICDVPIKGRTNPLAGTNPLPSDKAS